MQIFSRISVSSIFVFVGSILAVSIHLVKKKSIPCMKGKINIILTVCFWSFNVI